MGTTLAAIGIVADGEPVVVHVGDSRMYRFRNGRLDQLTADHSITGDLVRAGRLTETEALNHPQRHILTRALGVSPQVQVDVSDVSCEPGDRLLLCTDGVSKALSHQQIETALAATSDAQRLADDLITAAVTQGAEDNVTAVVVELS